MKALVENRRIVEVVIIILLLLLLLVSLFHIITPFIGVFAYVAILSVPLHGPFEKLVRLVGNRRKLAGFSYGFIAVCIIVIPFIFLTGFLADKVDIVIDWFKNAKENGVGPLPEWVSGIPVVGGKIAAFWTSVEANPAGTIQKYEPQILGFLTGFLSKGAGLIGAALEIVVAVIISAVVLTSGSKVLNPLHDLMRKLLGDPNGEEILDATGRAIKGVTVGALGTAIICAVAAWIGYAIVGLQFAVLFAIITFLLVLVQVGPLLVWLPVTFYVASLGNIGNTIFIAIYGVVVLLGIDNILKPILIGRSGKMPVLVLFLGVIGGMIAWGFTGMFKGAIILAIFYTLITKYLAKDNTKIEEVPELPQR
ncbi:MAG: AI-2E family transporter [Bacteroidetes bacterium]|nr:AI-2E family transporter [Bacteroidota bacterium]